MLVCFFSFGCYISTAVIHFGIQAAARAGEGFIKTKGLSTPTPRIEGRDDRHLPQSQNAVCSEIAASDYVRNPIKRIEQRAFLADSFRVNSPLKSVACMPGYECRS